MQPPRPYPGEWGNGAIPREQGPGARSGVMQPLGPYLGVMQPLGSYSCGGRGEGGVMQPLGLYLGGGVMEPPAFSDNGWREGVDVFTRVPGWASRETNSPRDDEVMK